jgi:hypothetical protein
MTRGEPAHPGIARHEALLHDRLAQVSLTENWKMAVAQNGSRNKS